MNYFSDIQFVGGGIVPNCSHQPIDHRFSSIYSLQYDRHGTIYYNIKGQKRVILEPPVIYLLHPDHHYQYGLVNPNRDSWHHSWLAFRGKRAQKIFERGFAKIAPHGYIKIHKPLLISSIFDSILVSSQQSNPESQCQASVYLEQLLVALTYNNHDNQPISAHQTLILEISEQVKEYPNREWDFRSIAKHGGISYSHFRKQFKLILGQAPHDFLLQALINWSCVQMKNSSKTIQQIADECGYKDLAYFSRVFKKQMGLSPRQYRQSLHL